MKPVLFECDFGVEDGDLGIIAKSIDLIHEAKRLPSKKIKLKELKAILDSVDS